MTDQHKKVIVDVEVKGGDTVKKVFDNGKAAAEQMDATVVANLKNQQKDIQRVIDLEIALARTRGEYNKAFRLTNEALDNEFNSESRNLSLLIKRAQIQQELGALTSQPFKAQAQVQETDLAKRAAEQDAFVAAQKRVALEQKQQAEDAILRIKAEQAAWAALKRQIEETDLAKAKARGQLAIATQGQAEDRDVIAAKERGKQLALEEKQIEETSFVRAKAAQQAIADANKQIDGEIRLALATGDETRALNLNAQAQAAAAGDTERLNRLKIQQAQIEKGIATSQSEATRASRGARDALFAVGLALNVIINEMGTQLPPAAKQAASGIKIVADAMLAGAYIGGAQGAVLGTLAGVLLAVGSAAFTIDPALKSLNESLDKLGKKDDAATGLSNLTGISRTNATLALEYVKANDTLAESFRAQVGAAQPAIPVLQGIGDLTRAVGDGVKSLNDAITTNISAYKDFASALGTIPNALQRGIVYWETFKDALASGKSVADADAMAIDAMNRMLQNNALAAGMATRETLALAEAQRAVVASASATSLGRNLLDAGDTRRDALEDSSVQFYSRMGEIARDGLARIAEINATWSARIVAIDKELERDRVDAFAAFNTSIVDAERDTADRRNVLASELAISIADAEQQGAIKRQEAVDSHNDRLEKDARDLREKLLQIEISYQNAIRDIQDSYNLSRFNAIANQDARALVQANMAREAALRKERQQHQQQLDAVERQRLRDADDAKVSYEKQQKNLSDALARQEEKLRDNFDKQNRALDESLRKQEAKLREDYEKRIRALEDAAQKQKGTADETRTKDLAAQITAQQKAEQSESDSWDARTATIDRAYALRMRALATALANEKDMTDNAGRAIINSLKYILSPSQMENVLREFESAMQARINVTVLPFSATKNPLYGYAEGGYTGERGGYVHPREFVLPLSNPQRTSQLMQQYIPPRVMQQMPAWANSRSVSASNNSGELHVHVHMDSGMLNATIVQNTEQMLMQVIPQVHQNLTKRGM